MSTASAAFLRPRGHHDGKHHRFEVARSVERSKADSVRGRGLVNAFRLAEMERPGQDPWRGHGMGPGRVCQPGQCSTARRILCAEKLHWKAQESDGQGICC